MAALFGIFMILASSATIVSQVDGAKPCAVKTGCVHPAFK